MLFVANPSQLRYSLLQRSYNFDVQLPEIESISGTLVGGYCQDIKFGDYSLATTDLRFGAFKSKYASGDTEISDVTMTFLKPIPDFSTAYFYAWRNLIIDQNGYYGIKSAYAKGIYVYLYDVTGFMVGKIQLVGAFPKTMPDYDLSYESETVSKFSITFSVDRISFGEFSPTQYAESLDTPITEVGITTTSIKSQQSKTTFTGTIPTVTSVKAPSPSPSTKLNPFIQMAASFALNTALDLGLKGLGQIGTAPSSAYNPKTVPSPSLVPNTSYPADLKRTSVEVPAAGTSRVVAQFGLSDALAVAGSQSKLGNAVWNPSAPSAYLVPSNKTNPVWETIIGGVQGTMNQLTAPAKNFINNLETGKRVLPDFNSALSTGAIRYMGSMAPARI